MRTLEKEIMEKEFIPYEQALSLKELGFKGSSFAYYIENRGITGTGSDIQQVYEYIHDTESFSNLICRVPTFSQAFKFFREKYDLEITTNIIVSKSFSTLPINKNYSFTIVKTDEVSTSHINKSVGTVLNIPSPEELEIQCMLKLIEIAKKINIGHRI
jgi:hypothetical protein